MISTYKHGRLAWVDLDNPISEETREVMKRYPVHPLVAEELLSPSPRPRVDVHEHVIYLILHFPSFDSQRKIFVETEVDFVLGKNFLLTAHYRDHARLHEIARMFETGTLSGAEGKVVTVGPLLFLILKELYEISIKELGQIQGKILAIEEEVFARMRANRHDLVRKISHVRRDVLDFRRTLQPHRDILAAVRTIGEPLGKTFSVYVGYLNGEYTRLWHALENDKDTIESLQDTHDSIVSHRANEIMRTLTMMAFATFPLMVILNLFIVPAKSVPILGVTGDFWIVLAIVVLSGFGIYAFFKHKRWV